MNRYDWYFEQLISQGEMDQAFAWVEAAQQWFQGAICSDPLDPAGAWNGGILAGGGVTQQPVPDLSVRVGAIVAVDKQGRPIQDATAQTTVPVDTDEYGVATAVITPGNTKILSVFARWRRDLQAPATDGAGLEVYTQQLDALEYVVRQGVEAAFAPAPPALLPDALLLADIEIAFGQTTILTAHLAVDRREDWLRLVGTTITSFVAGTPRMALRTLFGHVDTIMGGGAGYTPGETWYGPAILGVVGGSAPTTTQTGLNAIVEDLAANGASGGARLVGAPAITGTAGAYADLPAANVSGHLASLATMMAAHPATTVTTTAYQGFAWLLLSSKNGFATGTLRSQAAGTATVVSGLGAYSSWILVRGITGTWTLGQGVHYGATYTTADAWLLARVDATSLVTGAGLQDTLAALATEIPVVDCKARELDFAHFETERSSGHRVDQAHLGGGDDPRGLAIELDYGMSVNSGDAIWPLPYQLCVTCATTNLVSLCRGWDYLRNQACAYAVGNEAQVSKIFLDLPLDTNYVDEEHMHLTIDAAGTLMTTLSPTRVPYAVAANKTHLFVLVSSGPTPGSAAEIYCYDMRVWRSGGLAQWVWTAALTATTNCMGVTKANSNLVADGTYVVALLGAEDCNTGTPLVRVDAATGLNCTLGKGDGDGGIGGLTPTGGLAIAKNHVVFYTCSDGATHHLMIPATAALGSTAKGQMVLAGPATDVALVGRYACCVPQDIANDGYLLLRAWDYTDDDAINYTMKLLDTSDTYEYARVAFGAGRIWVKACDDLAGETHALLSLHPAQIVYRSPSRELACAERYQVTPPLASGAIGGAMGRLAIIGGAIYSIYQEAASSVVYVLPLTRAVR